MEPIKWHLALQTLELTVSPCKGLLATLKRGAFCSQAKIEGFPSIPYDKLIRVPFKEAFYPIVFRCDNGSWGVRFAVRGLGGCWGWFSNCFKAEKEDERPLMDPAAASYQSTHQKVWEEEYEVKDADDLLEPTDPGQSKQKIEALLKNQEESARGLDDFIPLSCSLGGTKRIGLQERFLSFLEGPQKVLLLLGSAGSGKTSFCQAMTRYLSEELSEYTPVIVSLPSLKKPVYRLTTEFFTSKAFTPGEIAHIKKSNNFILFLDGFDEIGIWKNLYVTNRLYEWNVKVVITCRPEYLRDVQETLDLFTPQVDDRPSLALLQYLFVSPFSSEQIQEYIERYVATHDTAWKEAKQYLSCIEKIPSLCDLIATPFILKIVCEVLPEIYEAHSQEYPDRQIALTRFDLYQAFISKWLQRKQLDPHMQERVAVFCKELAVNMHKAGVFHVVYDPSAVLFSSPKEQQQWAPFFGDDNREAMVLRANAPLMQPKKGEWAFLHPSIRDFFVSTALFEKRQKSNPTTISLPQKTTELLNKAVLVQEQAIMHFLSDFYNADPERQKLLFDIVLLSRAQPKFKIAAANAITILNMGRFRFSGLDLSRICVPGADLSGGLFHQANFTGADLRGVKFSGAYLSECCLDRALMDKVEFGNWPPLMHQSEVSSVRFLPDGRLFVGTKDVESEEGLYFLWNLKTAERVYPNTSLGKPNNFPMSTGFAKISKDGKIVIVEEKDRAVARILKGHEFQEIVLPLRAADIAISPDGRMLAIPGGKKMFLVDPSNGDTVSILEDEYQITDDKHSSWSPRTVLFSLDNRLLLVGGYNEATIVVWDLQTKKVCFCLNGHARVFKEEVLEMTMAIHPNNRWLVSSGKATDTILWDLSNPSQMRVLERLPEKVTALAFSPTGRFLAVGAQSKVSLWDFTTMEPIKYFHGHRAEITSIDFSSDEQLLASGSKDSSAMIWNVNFEALHKTEAAFPPIRKVVMGGSGGNMLSLASDGQLIAWDLYTKKVQKTISDVQARYGSLRYSPDKKRVAILPITFSKGGKQDPDQRTRSYALKKKPSAIKIWDIERQKMTFTIDFLSPVVECAFSPDGKLFAAIHAYKETDEIVSEIYLLDLESRKIDKRDDYRRRVRYADFHPK